MLGKMIEYKSNSETYSGYLAEAKGGGPGVIVIQEWWGLVDHIKEVCDRLAVEGFTGLAPDLFKGEKTTSPDEAEKKFMALNIAETEKILRGAIQALLAQESCTSGTVGVVGFCMGGQLALYAAATNPDQVSACVNFYGIHPNVHPPLEKLKAPVLGIFAENDAFVNAQAVEGLRRKLQQAGKLHEFHVYPGTDHAFFNDKRPEVHNSAAADDAWQKTLNFFRKTII